MTLAESFATTIFSIKLMHDCIWPSEIEVSIGSSLKKAEGEEKEKKKKKENKLFMAFRGKAKILENLY